MIEVINIHSAKIIFRFIDKDKDNEISQMSQRDLDIEGVKHHLADIIQEIEAIKLKLESLDGRTEGLPVAVNRLGEHISNLERTLNKC